MRFALLGAHPDGLEMAAALADSGRHQVTAYAGPADEAALRPLGPDLRRVGDVEEVLADPAVDALIVAGPAAARAAQLRRALQSERHVLCVCPPDQTPDGAYEAAMVQKDTGCVLLPLLPEGLHPAVRRLAAFVERPPAGQAPTSAVGAFQLLQFERASTGEVLDNANAEPLRPSLPGWDVLRALGGELVEVSALAEREGLGAGEPVLAAGRFERGGLFQMALLPNQPAAYWRLTVVGGAGRAELYLPQGWEGPAVLDAPGAGGTRSEEYWEPWDPWPALVEAFEDAVGVNRDKKESLFPLTWQDAVRGLELDDAARRSVERRRSSTMEYQEASEEVGFKGTMTLAGCGLLWAAVLLLVVSRWVPQLGWLILPLLVVFIGMQLLRLLIPKAPPKERAPGERAGE